MSDAPTLIEAQIAQLTRERDEARAEVERMRWLLEQATVFALGSDADPGTIRIEARGQRDGSRLWSVKRLSEVLGRDGEWEYEPIPSSRDDDFIARTRFAKLGEAWERAEAVLRGEKAKP